MNRRETDRSGILPFRPTAKRTGWHLQNVYLRAPRHKVKCRTFHRAVLQSCNDWMFERRTLHRARIEAFEIHPRRFDGKGWLRGILAPSKVPKAVEQEVFCQRRRQGKILRSKPDFFVTVSLGGKAFYERRKIRPGKYQPVKIAAEMELAQAWSQIKFIPLISSNLNSEKQGYSYARTRS